MEFTERWRKPVTSSSWLVWLAVAIFLTWQPFLWHVEYFKTPGPQFHRLLLIFLPLLACGIVVYQRLRRRGFWRHELALLASLLLAACLVKQPAATLVALWFFVACYAAGGFGLRKLGIETSSHAEKISLAAGLGLGVLGCILFVLGYVQGYRTWVFVVLLAFPCIVFHRQAKDLARALRGIDRIWRSTSGLSSPFMGVVIVFAALFLSFTTLVTLAPSINIDAMLYHLPEIRYYASTHSLQPLPDLRYSYFPQSVELWMTVAYSLGRQPAAQMINPLVFLLTLLLAFALARQCQISRAAAVAGVAIAGTIPFLHWTGSILKNDFALAFFQMAALYCYLRGRRSENANWLRLGIFFLCMSFGVKHVAVFGAIPLGMLYLHASWRRPRLLGSFVLIGLLFGFHWHIRAFMLTGDPVYPYGLNTATKQFHPMEGGSRPSLPALYVKYPWIVHFKGKQSFEGPSENPSGIFLVLFAPVWLLLRRASSQEERICLFFCAIYYLYWGYIWGVLRYALVPFILVFLFTTARAMAFHDRSPRWLRGLIQGALAYSFIFAMLSTMLIEVNAPQLRLFAGQLDARGYLREAVSYFPSLEYLEAHAGPDDLILSMDNCAHGYAPRVDQFHFISYWDHDRALERFKRGLRKERYAYVILPAAIGKEFTEALLSAYKVELSYRDKSFLVYKVVDAVS